MTDAGDTPDESTETDSTERAEKIALLNDRMRANLGRSLPNHTTLFMGDLAQELHGIDSLTRRQLLELNILASIQRAAFNEDNDPHGERDFGSLEFSLSGFNEGNEKIFWKIDYYDLAQQMHSPDATDPAVTHRVMTIFYARDY